ncbi:MAG: hypothetical protein ACREVG_20720 [Burkholderiales bacterium]
MHDVLRSLALEHGASFFLFDPERFVRDFESLRRAFRDRYPGTQLAYSYKTNYLPALCKLANGLGGYAEVVSAMEYRLARAIGVPAPRIVFNGPHKPGADLRKALLEGAMVNLDSAAEIEVLRALAAEYAGRRIAYGLRCNFDAGDGVVSRFGFDARDRAFFDLVAELRRTGNCVLEGLHCHYVTATKSAQSYASIAARMLELSDKVFGSTPPRYLNVGGGFFSPMPEELQAQFGGRVPTFDEYAEAIAGRFRARYPGERGPELILEPGISVAAACMRFCTPVVALKRVAGRTFAVVAGSVYDVKPTKHAKNLPLEVVPRDERSGEEVEDCDIVGHTCMEDDTLYAGFSGRLAVGDYLTFSNVGGYSLVLKPPFIVPAAAVLGWSESGKGVEVLRRAERYEEVFATFVM